MSERNPAPFDAKAYLETHGQVKILKNLDQDFILTRRFDDIRELVKAGLDIEGNYVSDTSSQKTIIDAMTTAYCADRYISKQDQIELFKALFETRPDVLLKKELRLYSNNTIKTFFTYHHMIDKNKSHLVYTAASICPEILQLSNKRSGETVESALYKHDYKAGLKILQATFNQAASPTRQESLNKLLKQNDNGTNVIEHIFLQHDKKDDIKHIQDLCWVLDNKIFNPNEQDAHGLTLLDKLAIKGDKDSPVVELLISSGATYNRMFPKETDLSAATNGYKTPQTKKKVVPAQRKPL